MFDSLKKSPLLLGFGAVVLGSYLFAEFSGVAFGGSRKPQRLDPTQIRQQSPGSWRYIYWAHGVRGK